MINNKKIAVVMPAYNAGRTLEKTYRFLPMDIVDDVILVDDCSSDDTSDKARKLGIQHVIRHDTNKGYGANQKTCYRKALDIGADIIIMVHPDYQYEPKLVTAMASLIAQGVFDCTLGSRILGQGTLKGGMPVYKYMANRILTLYQNLLIPYKLSEYHTGFRAFSKTIIESLPLDQNSDDYIFDNQMLLQIIGAGYSIGEITCPTRYLEDSSSIGFMRSIRYGLAVVTTTLEYKLARLGFMKSRRFDFRKPGDFPLK
ncbi:MAG: glycosyl transferase family 2 [Gammaproteobacteria bacterium RBG_16_51_14]|nr:MAG: glycosyl transferase family 2 [Gammaproteobacteria bacterium RBG_16_51_14]